MNVYERAIAHFGKEAQLRKTIEELKELELEVRRALDGNPNVEAIKEEVADVLNMCEQLRYIFDFGSRDVSIIANIKMNRTMQRIEAETE